jgi:uncharacterized membrane protein
MKKIFLYLMVLFLLGGGIYHFVNPATYVSIMPSWFPVKEILNWVSGGAEIVLALLLIPEKTRTFSSNLIVLMFISFFLVHIGHLFEPPVIISKGVILADFRGDMYSVLYGRILAQFVLIYWAYKIR